MGSYAQYHEWSTPQLMTTEGEDCFCGSVNQIQLNPSSNDIHYLIYNKKINDSTIGVFARPAYNPETEIEIFCEAGKICSFNGIMNTNYTTTDPMIFFDQRVANNNQRNIYFVKLENGIISDPVAFAESLHDEHNLDCTLNPLRVVWQCDDVIKTQYFQYDYTNDTLIAYNECVVEEENCHDPIVCVGGTIIRYIKNNESNQEIHEALVYNTNPIIEITTRFEAQEINSLKRPIGVFGDEESANWQRFDGLNKIFICDWQRSDGLDSLNWIQEKSFNASFLQYDLLCDNFYDVGCIAATLDNDTTQDIYASSWHIPQEIEDLINVSNSEDTVQNPMLSLGVTQGWYFDIILVYEEIKEGNRHLMTSKQKVLLGGTNENPIANKNSSIFPNPITSNFTVTIKNPATNEMQFTLYGLNGMKSQTLLRNVSVGAVNEIQFSVKDFGSDIVPGPNILECKNGDKVETLKIMIL